MSGKGHRMLKGRGMSEKAKELHRKVEQTCGMQNLQQRRDEFGVTVLAF